MSLLGGGRALGADRPLRPDRPVGAEFATRSAVLATRGVAATSQPLATQVALEVMRRGGSAVDAAIAANAALGLMEPTGCGIGGDLYAIVWDAKSGRLYGLNASGRAPRGVSLEGMREAAARARGADAGGPLRIPPRGALPVTVPGAVDGWFELHGRFGRLPMREVLAPAIAYARDGFPVAEVIAHYWERNARVLQHYPNFRETFMPGGRAPRTGEIFRNPALANTYGKIARGGRDAFYRGEIPRAIERHLREQGGFLAAADFEAHRSTWVEPISTRYRGHDVWQLPPNGQGLAVLQMLNLLEGYDLKAMGFGSADYLHVLIEAKKLAYADRARFYADGELARVPVLGLASKAYAAERRKLIAMDRALPVAAPGDPAPYERSDTIYLAVADGEGNMVSLIQSNYRGMGSGITPPGLGFVLQNRGEAFALQPGLPNSFAPGKRPFHTIIPGFVTKDGRPYLAFGVMGGAMQPQGQVQVLINHLDFGMNLQEAGDAPRLRHDGAAEPDGTPPDGAGKVMLERGFKPEVLEALRSRGHEVQFTDDGDFGGYQAVAREPVTGVLIGASESRKDGQAAGF